MATSIPGATQAFVAIAAAALPVTALVWQGKALGVYTAPITLQVLHVVGDQVPAELGPNYRREETYSIECQLTSFAGDEDFASRQAEVFANFELVAIAVANNPTLNSTVRFAQCGNFDYEPDADASGKSLGCLTFEVRCEARVTSLT